ncbi:MAG: ribonuclease R [Saprospiraceae bacterium]|nr:ribonuclease R [Saprospiraceae bacterium]MDW8484427.1 ribonuclease R [Saprospiraceae bacterium]
MKKNKKNGRKKLTAKALQIEVLKFLLANPKKTFAPSELSELLNVANNRHSVEHALQQLMQAGSVEMRKNGRYGAAIDRLTSKEKRTEKPPSPTAREDSVAKQREKSKPKQPKIIEGRIDITRSGAAYVVTDALAEDVFVAPRYLNGALHGDLVQVLLFPTASSSKRSAYRRPEGEVIRVLKRAREVFIGTLRKSRKYALFFPDDPNMPMDIYVPLEACGEARDSDKVIVRITDWQEGKGRVPIGKVTHVLGSSGGHDFEMNKILINAGFELHHSPEAFAEAAEMPDFIPPEEYDRRRDFRSVLTFTIDPEDAKDFDDAISIRTLENGHLEIGVHIADVTYYLKAGTRLDAEAYQRSTSVYLVDRVCPMLPEKLSNHLCSLVPYEDRLTFSAVFVFDEQDCVVSRWFGKTIIHSVKRFSYEEAQTILEGKPTEALRQLTIYPQLEWALKTLHRIAEKMRRERERNGAIGFDTEEVRFRLSDDGRPLEAYVKVRKEAHRLIEDFMLLANREVALFIQQKAAGQQEIPFVYRVHDLPDMEKVAEFARFAAEMGYPIKVNTPRQIAESYNQLMRAAESDPRLKILEPLAIRTMAKAIYSTRNIGHYGLGFSHYTHFTSPIRRYADILVHRILEGNLGESIYRVNKERLEEQCKHISEQERKAADAERESVRYMQVELLQRHVGEVFEGFVSGFIERGFFVELPDTLAEGLVDFRSLREPFIVEDGNLRARALRTHRVIKIGDRVRVRIVAVDSARRQIEMEWVDDIPPTSIARKR